MKVSISDFSVEPDKETSSYDLKMHVENATDNWCVTSLAIVYSFGDARGQEWLANEYPAVKKFSNVREIPLAARTSKTPPPAPAHSVGLSPGQDEARTMFDVYFYIQPRPLEYFDGFHLISAQVKSCLGYQLTKPN